MLSKLRLQQLLEDVEDKESDEIMQMRFTSVEDVQPNAALMAKSVFVVSLRL